MRWSCRGLVVLALTGCSVAYILAEHWCQQSMQDSALGSMATENRWTTYGSMDLTNIDSVSILESRHTSSVDELASCTKGSSSKGTKTRTLGNTTPGMALLHAQLVHVATKLGGQFIGAYRCGPSLVGTSVGQLRSARECCECPWPNPTERHLLPLRVCFASNSPGIALGVAPCMDALHWLACGHSERCSETVLSSACATDV
jgi:hypothetical protein